MGIVKRALSRIGVSRPNMAGGNKVQPTTKAQPAPNATPGRHTRAEKEERKQGKG